jgi:hypothetical protein
LSTATGKTTASYLVSTYHLQDMEGMNKEEKVKRANKIKTPGPDTDIHGNIIGKKMPLVSMVKDYIELSSTYQKQKLPKSFEEMERHGLRITSWEERVG